MSKEEFLNTVNSILENLKIEHLKAQRRAYYYRTFHPNSKEQAEAEYLEKFYAQRLYLLQQMLSFPAYTRINTMSDIEIESYKREKISELELAKKEIKIKRSVAERKNRELHAREDDLIARFVSSTSPQEKENIIFQGKQLQSELSFYDVESSEGIFAEIRKKLEKIDEEINKINSENSKDIKDKLLSNFQNSNDFEKMVKNVALRGLNSSSPLLATVSNDYQKANKLTELLAKYRKIVGMLYDKKIMTEQLSLSYNLPKDLRIKLRNYKVVNMMDCDILLEKIGKYERLFEEEKNKYLPECMADKISKFSILKKDEDKVDDEFLSFHSNKITKDKIEELNFLYTKFDKLSKKKIKSTQIKIEIKSLMIRIRNLKISIYKQVLGWYKIHSSDILGIDLGDVTSLTTDMANAYEEDNNKKVADAFKEIQKLRQQIEKCKASIESKKKNLEEQKEDVVGEIKVLVGYDKKVTGENVKFMYNENDKEVIEQLSDEEDTNTQVKISA